MSALFDVTTVHCFFARTCSHTASGLTPQEAHDRMEAHYSAAHQAEINRIVGDWNRRVF